MGVGRLVSTKNWSFSGSMFIYHRVISDGGNTGWTMEYDQNWQNWLNYYVEICWTMDELLTQGTANGPAAFGAINNLTHTILVPECLTFGLDLHECNCFKSRRVSELKKQTYILCNYVYIVYIYKPKLRDINFSFLNSKQVMLPHVEFELEYIPAQATREKKRNALTHPKPLVLRHNPQSACCKERWKVICHFAGKKWHPYWSFIGPMVERF